MVDEYQYYRMVLREEMPRGIVEGMASKGLWSLVEDNESDNSAAYMYFRTWGVVPGLWVSLTEDLATQVKALTVFGEELAEVAELGRRVSIILQPYERMELVNPPKVGLNKHGNIRTVIRAALAAGEEFDRELFDVILRASCDSDPDVRNAAAWATTYLSWPQSLDMLRVIARDDPDRRIRDGAAVLLNDFREGDK